MEGGEEEEEGVEETVVVVVEKAIVVAAAIGLEGKALLTRGGLMVVEGEEGEE